ncbi:MAG: transcriptional regulator [Giesbergeria sp.]|uniref:helix-turn-helix domain-containing protein n=1 Tax=Giesbergeria sp. TaxID=2818473 RepID=UPI002620A834|nr:transcriptional regulator [Giesbergeria sp.]MDD2608829.1 transcriptional regulator [Giesbergeria sp.]
MYHYTESGLQNIWLANGYAKRTTAQGEAVAIHALDTLHNAIGRILATRPKLTGAGLRFLRQELGLSQKRLGDTVGASEETVSLWERRGRIPKSADRIVRAIYLEHLDGNVHVTQMIQRLIELDEKPDEKLVFAETDQGWRMAA